MSKILKRQYALEELKNIETKKDSYLIIHYSSESFFNLNGESPRISSIAVHNLKFNQTKLFAIYQTAETMQISRDEIMEQYEAIERNMLAEFYEFVKNNNTKIWIHWNMRDNNYGFSAIEHRFKVLGGTPEIITDDKKIDLALLLKNLYGQNYIEDPKMLNILKFNNIFPKNFLSGEQESIAFDSGDFYKLSMSTSSKVRAFSNIIDLAIDNSLKTNTPKLNLYGTGIKARFLAFKETIIGKVTVSISMMIIGTLISKLIEFYWNKFIK